MINLDKITLKRSNKTEVVQAVPLIYSSGPDAFEYVFKNTKNSAQDFLAHAFVREGGEFSYQNHYSLYQDEQMLGIGSIFNAKEAAAFSTKDATNILRFYTIRSIPILRRGLQVEGLIKLPEKKEIAIAHLGIKPVFRGKGLGTRMIALLREKAKKEAGSYFVLDVSEENPKAKALYDRLGFITTKKNNSSLRNKFSYVPNHFRMELRTD